MEKSSWRNSRNCSCRRGAYITSQDQKANKQEAVQDIVEDGKKVIKEGKKQRQAKNLKLKIHLKANLTDQKRSS
ncbi:MAG: hypothetical protein MZU97_10870 [Bacillus subtilis]|nr:hypothetical protein [Bacillus subtilis]